jgi:hypothetical protein
MAMKSPQAFVEIYTGKLIDNDHAYGVQCVDGFQTGNVYLEIPTMPTPNNWADGYWTCLDANGNPSPTTEAWVNKYFDRIRNPEDFRNGDWVIWARGSKSHPSSHIAMWYNGQEFGENQGGDRSFCLKSTDFSDALGALRPKAWSLSIPSFESNMTICGHLYYLFRKTAALKAVVLSPGLNKTALIKDMDCDADVYVDSISHKPVAVFSKKKIESRIGGASKTISYKDPKLFAFVKEVCSVLELNGPCDMDFFIKDGEYYLSEINPRFGGAYLHAYGAGVDFIKLILNNIDGKENQSIIGQYDEDVIMMMYDDVVIKRKSELMSDEFSLL